MRSPAKLDSQGDGFDEAERRFAAHRARRLTSRLDALLPKRQTLVEGVALVFAGDVPVIGSTADGSREALMDGKLGLFVDPGDRSALIQAISEALARPRGRPPGLEYFDVCAYRQRVAALVREVVSEAGLR